MAEVLRVRDADDERHGGWCWLEAGTLREGDAAAVARAAGERGVLWLADSRRVTLHEVVLPRRNRSAARQALPYLLEDQVADDLETLVFQPAMETAGGKVIIAVTAREWYEARLQGLVAAGCELTGVVPDAMVLPPAPAGATALLEPDRLLLRDGDQGWACDAEAAPVLLGRLAAERPGGRLELALLLPADAGDNPLVLPDNVVAETRRLEAPGDTALLSLAGEPPFNLLAEEGRSQRARAQRPYYLAAAGAVVVAIAVLIGGLYYSNHRLAATSDALQAAIETEFRRGFPEVQRIVKPAHQARQAIAELREAGQSGPRFLDVLARAGAALREGGSEPLVIERMGFSAGRLDLQVSAASMAALEAYRTRLAEHAVQAEIVSAENRDERLYGRLRLRERAL